MEGGTGFPGYNTLMPKSVGTFSEVLRQSGYNTAWYGKNHNIPDWHNSQAGPFDLWPTGLGFEYFYGFIGGDTSQWAPAIFEGIKRIEPPHDDKDYFFEKDMADKAIERIRLLNALAPDKPWVTYYAPGTAHAPHHAPKDWIAKFKGQFDQGWDKVREETLARQKAQGVVPQDTQLTERSEGIPAWDSLDADHKRVAAHMMEVYAAALSYCDSQMGRVVDAIADMGKLDNTLIIYIQGDNGASAEGGPQGLLNEMSFFNAIPEDFSEVMRRMGELGGRRRSTITRSVGRMRWTRRSNGRSRSPLTSAARATAWSSRGPTASRTRAAFAPSSTMSSTSRRPSSKPPACKCRQCSMVCRKSRSRA
jgi:arylsulfatase A-like enzyme